ncbi:MAG: hypothetical protein RLY93_13300 [Sumerlaeia bacterium]
MSTPWPFPSPTADGCQSPHGSYLRPVPEGERMALGDVVASAKKKGAIKGVLTFLLAVVLPLVLISWIIGGAGTMGKVLLSCGGLLVVAIGAFFTVVFAVQKNVNELGKACKAEYAKRSDPLFTIPDRVTPDPSDSRVLVRVQAADGAPASAECGYAHFRPGVLEMELEGSRASIQAIDAMVEFAAESPSLPILSVDFGDVQWRVRMKLLGLPDRPRVQEAVTQMLSLFMGGGALDLEDEEDEDLGEENT